MTINITGILNNKDKDGRGGQGGGGGGGGGEEEEKKKSGVKRRTQLRAGVCA